MEEIFANPGLQLIAEKICHFMSPKSFQSLILTSKFMMTFSANVSEKWFLKCQKAKLITDVKKWALLLNFAQKHEMEWNLGLIFKFIYHKRFSKSSSTYCDFIQDPFKIVSHLGQIKLLKLILEDKTFAHLMKLFPGTSFERKNYVIECLEIVIKARNTTTFKAFKGVLRSFLEKDRFLLETFIHVARSSHATEIQKILALCLNQPSLLGQRPMHSLAYDGNVEENIRAVEFAASLCNNPNQQDDFGTTPMHIAAEHGYLEFVKVLLPYWENQMVQNQNNKTAIEIAEDKGHHEIANLLYHFYRTY